MKKTILLSLLVCTLLFGGTVASAATYDLLSEGITAIAAQNEMVKGGIEGSTVSFPATDFKQAMGLRRFESITVTSLPDEASGTLLFGGKALSAPVTIPCASLAELSFVPKDKSVKEATFSFTCEQYAGGATVLCIIRLAEKVNSAPAIQSDGAFLAVSTLKNMKVCGTLSATDAEGDSLIYLVASYPKHGTLFFEDRVTGEFSYTPTAGYTGKDEFSVVVRDCYGNYSAPAKVSLTVEKPSGTLTYSDLADSTAALPALLLAQDNIMLGTLVGDDMYFSPQAEVSRGEFLTMAMKAAGISPRAGLAHTVFEDDAAIPDGIRPYVATAQECGYIIGDFRDEGLVFDAAECLSRGEAAVILSRILGLEVPVGAPVEPECEGETARVATATRALLAAGIYPRNEEGLLAVSAPLTRECAAEMLYATTLYCR